MEKKKVAPKTKAKTTKKEKKNAILEIPTTLKHKPVIIDDDYYTVDGKKAHHTDAKGLTLGLAQWNDRGKVDISAKVWRFTGAKWSRQSEELPIHRVLDLAILVARSVEYFEKEAITYKKFYDKKKTKIDQIPLQGESMNIRICDENPKIEEDIKLFVKALGNDSEFIKERLKTLSTILKEMGY